MKALLLLLFEDGDLRWETDERANEQLPEARGNAPGRPRPPVREGCRRCGRRSRISPSKRPDQPTALGFGTLLGWPLTASQPWLSMYDLRCVIGSPGTLQGLLASGKMGG